MDNDGGSHHVIMTWGVEFDLAQVGASWLPPWHPGGVWGGSCTVLWRFQVSFAGNVYFEPKPQEVTL